MPKMTDEEWVAFEKKFKVALEHYWMTIIRYGFEGKKLDG